MLLIVHLRRCVCSGSLECPTADLPAGLAGALHLMRSSNAEIPPSAPVCELRRRFVTPLLYHDWWVAACKLVRPRGWLAYRFGIHAHRTSTVARRERPRRFLALGLVQPGLARKCMDASGGMDIHIRSEIGAIAVLRRCEREDCQRAWRTSACRQLAPFLPGGRSVD